MSADADAWMPSPLWEAAFSNCGLRRAYAAVVCVDLNNGGNGMKAEEVRISEWEGYQRKDFKLDGHECILGMPKEVHPGKPWVWRAEFIGAFDYADRALLEKGWLIANMMISDMYGCPESISLMEMFYQYIIEEEGLNKKADLFGFSRGGLYSVNYTVKNPETISTLYLDAPVMNVTSWPGGYGASARYS